jgi:lipoprotein-anchoring transpeptidase ErfK/SrfK
MAGGASQRSLRMATQRMLRLYPSLALIFGAAGAACMASACGHPETTSSPGAAAPVDTSAGQVAVAPTAVRDAGPVDAPYDGPMIYALFPHTPVMSDMFFPVPEAKRKPGEKKRVSTLGYIRQGGRVPVIPEAHPNQDCSDGWYELLAGGFVCGKFASLDAGHPRVKVAPHAPYLDQALPYQYGYNLTNGTPLYKQVPSQADRIKYEPWLRPKHDDANPYPDDSVAVALSASGGVNTNDPLGAFDPWDSGVPWYLKTYDGGKPTDITLDDLREEGGVVDRRMVKGFYLALDREIDTGPHRGMRWWRTTSGQIAPHDRIFVAKPATEYHGVWLGVEPPPEDVNAPINVDGGPPPRPNHKIDFPVGFVLWFHAHKYTLNEDHTKATAGDSVPRFAIVHLTGNTARVAGFPYEETDEGWWMRMNEGTKSVVLAPPKDLAPGEKWIDVNLKTQTLVAFEGERPVYATIVSTGKIDQDVEEKDHRTKPGTFRIREKHIAATMDGDVASDGPYSIEDVPWIMYFNGSIALHGAFWHQNFGHVQSHGCVNLSPLDAKALFGWTDPQLPAGWHGVWAGEDRPGTRVVVHDPPDPPHWVHEE